MAEMSFPVEHLVDAVVGQRNAAMDEVAQLRAALKAVADDRDQIAAERDKLIGELQALKD